MKNWKTTIVGAIGAVFTVVWPLIETGGIDAKSIATAAIVAILGYLAKDAVVSGTGK